MSTNFDRQALVSIFVMEATDGLARLWKVLQPADGNLANVAELQSQYITAHTLKGASSLYGFMGVAKLAEELETALEQCSDVAPQELLCRVSLLRSLVNALRVQIEAIAREGDEEPRCWETWQANHSRVSDAGSVVATDSFPDNYLNPEVDPEILSYFVPETQEYLEVIEAAALRLEKDPENVDVLQQLFRTAHTLKGSAYTVGFRSIGDLIHHVEDFMGAVQEGRRRVSAGLIDALLRAIDVIRLLLRRNPDTLETSRREFVVAIERLRALTLVNAPDEEVCSVVSASSAASTAHQRVRLDSEAEARQETENKPSEESEVIRVSRDRLERLLNLVGELATSRGRLEQRLVALGELTNQVVLFKGRMLESVRIFEEKHAYTIPAVSLPPASRGPRSLQGFHDFGILELDRYDDFNILARRLVEVSADVAEAMAQLTASIRKAQDDMNHLQRLSLSLRDEIARARMVPIGAPFTRFRRAVREMAKVTGKQATLITSGEQTEVDTSLVERLVDPLIHLVRNAVYHGIEPADARHAKGKPAMGSIALRAAHRGNAVIIEVEDDGAGIDIDRVKSRAIALGLVAPDVVSSITDYEAINLIFLPGFSTAEEAGHQAGRGVGMDVVKRAIEAVNGQIEVATELGVGTKFTLRLPLTLLVSMALLVRVGTERYAVPLQSIREVVQPKPEELQDLNGRCVLNLREETVEVHSLAHLLGIEALRPAGPPWIIIVRTAVGVLGLTVDELLGRQEIVIKSLGTLRPFVESCFMGASIDPEGQVVLVLDVGRLIGSFENKEAASSALARAEMRPPESDQPTALEHPAGSRILLIDDSLSIRKFVGKMLEGVGYQVETANDGEEGLRRAAERSYDLIITDLEMPKLNGYEVIQAMRRRSHTKATPILVMTTRAGEKHRQMAASVGASGYITKPVEERALILEVNQWISQSAGSQT